MFSQMGRGRKRSMVSWVELARKARQGKATDSAPSTVEHCCCWGFVSHSLWGIWQTEICWVICYYDARRRDVNKMGMWE